MRSPHESEWAGDDFIEREWDLDDVVRATLERAELEPGIAPAGERDDRRVAVREPATDDVDELFELVEVDEGNVRTPTAYDVATFLRVRRSSHVVAAVLEGQANKVPQGLVHDDQRAR